MSCLERTFSCPPRSSRAHVAHVDMASYTYEKRAKTQNPSHMPLIGPSSHPKAPLARLSWGHELLGHRPSLRPSERPLSPPSEICGSDPKSARQVKTVVSQLVGRFESRSVGDTTPKAEYFEPRGQEKGFPLFFFGEIVLGLSQSSVKVDKSIFNSTAKHHPKKWVTAKGLRWAWIQ